MNRRNRVTAFFIVAIALFIVSSASAGEILPDDRIVAIDFTPVASLERQETEALLDAAENGERSLIVTLERKGETRTIFLTAEKPTCMQRTFMDFQNELLSIWENAELNWLVLAQTTHRFLLGKLDSGTRDDNFRRALKAFGRSRSGLCDLDIPGGLPAEVKSLLFEAKNNLETALLLRHMAARDLARSLDRKTLPETDLQTDIAENLYVAVKQMIKGRIMGETHWDDLTRVRSFIESHFFQADSGNTDEGIHDAIAEEASRAVDNAAKQLAKLRDPANLAHEALSYTVAAEYGWLLLLERLTMEYTPLERRMLTASGKGFSALVRARNLMGLSGVEGAVVRKGSFSNSEQGASIKKARLEAR